MNGSQTPDNPNRDRRVSRTAATRSILNQTEALRKYLEAASPVDLARNALISRERVAFENVLSHQDEIQRSIQRSSLAWKDMLSSTTSLWQRQEDELAKLAKWHVTGVSDQFQKATRDMFEAVMQPQREWERLQGRISSHEGRLAAVVADQFRSIESFALRSMGQIPNPLRDFATNELFERIAGQAERLMRERASTEPEEVSTGRIQQVSATVQEAIQSAADQPDFAAALAQILEAIRGTSDTVAQRILYFLVIPFLFFTLAAIVNPIADHYIKRSLSDSPQGDRKGVQERAQVAVGDPSALTHYRFVGAKTLTVRSGPRAKSPQVGALRFGQTVLILDQQGAFTQVIWTSSDGQSQVKGWVFTRYLEKFR